MDSFDKIINYTNNKLSINNCSKLANNYKKRINGIMINPINKEKLSTNSLEFHILYNMCKSMHNYDIINDEKIADISISNSTNKS